MNGGIRMFTYTVNNDIRLGLLEVRHAEELFALTDQSRESLEKWLPWVAFTRTVQDSKNFIEGTLKQFSDNNGFQVGIWYKDELAGVIGLHGINWTNKSTSIGYWLGSSFEGKGLMTKACQAVIQYCFEEYGLHRIEIRAATGNHKSIAIPERLDFTKEGCIREAELLQNGFVDHYVFGLLKSDLK